MRFIRKNLKIIIIILVIILIVVLSLIKIYLNNNLKIEEPIIEELEIKNELDINDNENNIIEQVKDIVYVDIKGAILNPGVYEIESGKKVIDVINLAGGLTEQANTSMINLAKQVTDEMVVIIYTNEEVEKAKQEEPIIKIVEKECVCPEIKNDACLEKNTNIDNDTSSETSNEKINLNKATIEELQTLDGIGETKAKAIIAYRQEKGKFNSIEELLEVTGIGEALYDKIK